MYEPKLKPRKKTNRVSMVCKTFHTNLIFFYLHLAFACNKLILTPLGV